jgi:mono/diheme cytochrome c family protein
MVTILVGLVVIVAGGVAIYGQAWIADLWWSRDSPRLVAQGRAIYAAHCASCHGAKLEGQPRWKELLPSGRLPAPPHDASGHTWHHADTLLFAITKYGTAAVVGGGYESDMPAFKDALSDGEIVAVLAFIKSTWPARERAYQEDMSKRAGEARQ